DMYSFYAEADFAPYVCLGGSDQIGVDFSKVIENTGLFVYMGDDMLSAASQSFTAVPIKTGKAVAEILPGIKVTFKVIDAKDVKKVTMYRLYNQTSGEHFYTAKEKEKDALVSFGWKYEGIGWTAPSISNQPVYRLYNEGSGDHHYSMKAKEKDFLVSIGWKYEGIGWYSDDAAEVPLYREYNPNMEKCNHNYTTNRKEHIALTTLLGWNDEGIGWYGLK
ncbi:MAG: hypothetical protein K6A40_02805, partial [Solobacterium sp.]|nr:hypothetical protein [Solobacterium sp.]